MIASKRHIQSIVEMNDEEYEELSRLIRETRRAIQETTQVENMTLIQEERSAHFHLWFFPWTKEVVERYGNPSLTRIREIMADFQAKSIDETEWNELEAKLKIMRARMERF